MNQDTKAEQIEKEEIDKTILYYQKLLRNQNKYLNTNFEMIIQTTINNSGDLKYLARRAFNSFCRAYQMLKEKNIFSLKKLNLHLVSKGFGLLGAKSKDTLGDKKYTEIKDAKKLS